MIRRIIIMLSYCVAATAVIVATIILVALGQGYSYNWNTGQFSINGLLALNSTPSSATLFVNGKAVHRKTPYRSTLTTGTYNLELRKDGYRTWTKQVDIRPYQVSQLSLILMIPQTIKSELLTPNQTASQLIASSDRRHFAYITTTPEAGLWVLNPDRKLGTKVYTAQAATADHPAEAIIDASWSEDGSHLLIHSQIDSVSSYLVVSASGGSPVNLTDLFKFDLSSIRFSSYDWRELFWNTPDGLRRLNIEAKTTSAVLASNVSAYTFAADRIVYVQATTLGKSLWSMDRSGNNPKQLIESLADSPAYQLEYANYHGRDIIAVLPEKSSTATLYFDIFSATPVSKVVSQNAAHMSFSDDGQYLAFYNTNGFGTYDVDKNLLLLAKQEPNSLNCLTWFDDAHVVVCRNNTVDLVELDGANRTDITALAPGTVAYGTNDQRHVYAIGVINGLPTGVYGFEIKK